MAERLWKLDEEQVDKVITFGHQLWEDFPITLAINYRLEEDEKVCKHVVDGLLKIVIIATNEGGYNTTGVCWQCIQEKIAELQLG